MDFNYFKHINVLFFVNIIEPNIGWSYLSLPSPTSSLVDALARP